MKNEVIFYQSKSGAIEFKADIKKETLWASLQQIAGLFDTDKSGISRHIKNIYKSGELKQGATVAKIATVQEEGKRKVSREVEFYNLDIVLSVGYRVNSKKATEFRKWATRTLRDHILKGYTVNKKILSKNYDIFLRATDEMKKLLHSGGQIRAEDALELIKMFASTWLSLDAYDKGLLPKSGATKKQVKITVDNILEILSKLKEELILKKEATELFGTERARDSIAGIIGNVFQTFDGEDLYPSIEEKAANLLYLIVKNHPFIDGNKRSEAFAFVWFLGRAGILDVSRLMPEALTTLTILVVESNSKDKERVVGLILMLLKK
ncbi:MAG: RhuM family protein [bacterium]